MQVPLTAVLLLFELTHDYFIIIPTLASVGISYWVASFPLRELLRPLAPLLVGPLAPGPRSPMAPPPPDARDATQRDARALAGEIGAKLRRRGAATDAAPLVSSVVLGGQ